MYTKNIIRCAIISSVLMLSAFDLSANNENSYELFNTEPPSAEAAENIRRLQNEDSPFGVTMGGELRVGADDPNDPNNGNEPELGLLPLGNGVLQAIVFVAFYIFALYFRKTHKAKQQKA